MTIELPRAYGTRVRNSLDASPTSIDFRQVSPYFYQFGTKLYDLIIDDQLPATLEKAFKARLKEIMNISLTGSTNVGQDFLQKLDETEKECKLLFYFLFFFWVGGALFIWLLV